MTRDGSTDDGGAAADADATADDAAGGGALDPAEQRRAVRRRYASIATDSDDGGCCGTGTATAKGDSETATRSSATADADASCCEDGSGESLSRALGYSRDELDSVADGANLGLGCGNPGAIAALSEGETVLDLGSGGGFDCFLAARAVGPTGRVVGVDMTPEMIETARANVERNDAENVEFRLGEIEHLPVADGSVDAVISNCVVNLSPDKPQVFREAFRVLRPGGRLAVSDVVLTAELPVDVSADPASVAACVAGAAPISQLEAMLADAGFAAVAIEPKAESEAFIRQWDDERDLSDYLVSATIEAEKPTTEA